MCSSTAAAIHLPYSARSHGGARQGVEGVPPTVRQTRTKLDYDHGNITYQMFSLAAAGVKNTVSVLRWLSGTGEEKMDPDKSVVFAYDGVPYVHSLCFPPRHRWKGFKLSGSDIKGRHLESGNLQIYNRNEGKALAIPLAEFGNNNCSAWSSGQKHDIVTAAKCAKGYHFVQTYLPNV